MTEEEILNKIKQIDEEMARYRIHLEALVQENRRATNQHILLEGEKKAWEEMLSNIRYQKSKSENPTHSEDAE